MRWCADCRSEWVNDVELCPSCGAATWTPEEREAVRRRSEESSKERFVSLGTVDGPIEENLVAEVFTQEGIPHFIRNRGLDNVGMMLIGQEGWARIFVPESVEAQAQEILDAIRTEDATDELAEVMD